MGRGEGLETAVWVWWSDEGRERDECREVLVSQVALFVLPLLCFSKAQADRILVCLTCAGVKSGTNPTKFIASHPFPLPSQQTRVVRSTLTLSFFRLIAIPNNHVLPPLNLSPPLSHLPFRLLRWPPPRRNQSPPRLSRLLSPFTNRSFLPPSAVRDPLREARLV